MNILKWAFQIFTDTGLEDSVREEHNRYTSPPKGIDKYRWFVMLNRAKYGDFLSGKRFKDED